MNERNARIIVTVLSVGVLIAVGGWLQSRWALSGARTQGAVTDLQPIAAMLKENLALIKELEADPYTEKDSGTLESYLAKIRRDGVPKHSNMRQRLDRLAENNSTIVALLDVYSNRAKTAAFTLEADRFRNYASAWRDRWNSVMQVFMAGGNYATSSVPFPKEFPAAVDAEIAANR